MIVGTPNLYPTTKPGYYQVHRSTHLIIENGYIPKESKQGKL